MWLRVSFLCFTLLCHSRAQEKASLSRFDDPSGRCQYTFTIASPEESSCSGSSSKPEIDSVLSRLTLLEALVSRLLAGADGGTGARVDDKQDLQVVYSQVTRERKQLQQDNERLNQEVQELQSTLAELRQEVKRPCQQTPSAGGREHEKRPASGMYMQSKTLLNTSTRPVNYQGNLWAMKCLPLQQIRLTFAVSGRVKEYEFTPQTPLLKFFSNPFFIFDHFQDYSGVMFFIIQYSFLNTALYFK